MQQYDEIINLIDHETQSFIDDNTLHMTAGFSDLYFHNISSVSYVHLRYSTGQCWFLIHGDHEDAQFNWPHKNWKGIILIFSPSIKQLKMMYDYGNNKMKQDIIYFLKMYDMKVESNDSVFTWFSSLVLGSK